MMDDDEGLSIPPPSLYPGSSGDEAGRGGGEVICQQVVNFDKMFSTRSANLLNELRYYGATETQALANLAARLDFNGFYSGGV